MENNLRPIFPTEVIIDLLIITIFKFLCLFFPHMLLGKSLFYIMWKQQDIPFI